MTRIGRRALIWMGIWLGLGAEASAFILWAVWKFLHSKLAARLDPDHIIHKIAEYFK